MHHKIDKLVSCYEKGNISRRELVGGLVAMSSALAAKSSASEGASATFTANGLNHIALNTPDVQVSRDFYVKHLGMAVARDSASNCFLTCEDDFLALFRSENAGLNHFVFR